MLTRLTNQTPPHRMRRCAKARRVSATLCCLIRCTVAVLSGMQQSTKLGGQLIIATTRDICVREAGCKVHHTVRAAVECSAESVALCWTASFTYQFPCPVCSVLLGSVGSCSIFLLSLSASYRTCFVPYRNLITYLLPSRSNHLMPIYFSFYFPLLPFSSLTYPHRASRRLNTGTDDTIGAVVTRIRIVVDRR